LERRDFRRADLTALKAPLTRLVETSEGAGGRIARTPRSRTSSWTPRRRAMVAWWVLALTILMSASA
jgi:hypothetical protein